MSLVILMLTLALLGVITWAIITYIPMPQGIKTLIIIVAVVGCVLYVMSAFGLVLPNMRVPVITTVVK